MDHTLNSQKTPHCSPRRVSYGVSIVSILEKTDDVIRGLDGVTISCDDCYVCWSCVCHKSTFNMNMNKTQVGHYCFHSQLYCGVYTFTIKGKTSTHLDAFPIHSNDVPKNVDRAWLASRCMMSVCLAWTRFTQRWVVMSCTCCAFRGMWARTSFLELWRTMLKRCDCICILSWGWSCSLGWKFNNLHHFNVEE